MGEPAELSADDRDAAVALAQSIYDAVVDDKETPIIDECPTDLEALAEDAGYKVEMPRRIVEWKGRVDLALFQLSQTLVETRAAVRDLLATHGHGSLNDDEAKRYDEILRMFGPTK